MAVKGVNPFEVAQAQFDKVAAILELDPATRDLLRFPLREHSFAIPVRMDDGSTVYVDTQSRDIRAGQRVQLSAANVITVQ